MKKGQAIFQLLPLLDPVGRATLTASKLEADGLVQNAEEQVKLAEIAVKRAKEVLAGGAGSQKMVDEAETQVGVAHKTLDAAKARRDLLNRVVGEAASGTAAPIPILAPQAGLIRNVSALAGQIVPANAPLFEVMDLDEVWVRVPVYVGELADTDTTGPANRRTFLPNGRPDSHRHVRFRAASGQPSRGHGRSLLCHHQLEAG